MRFPKTSHGVLLVIDHGAQQSWEIDGNWCRFPELVHALQGFADEFAAKKGVTISVCCIDVTEPKSAS
jgi:hypothetical protein